MSTNVGAGPPELAGIYIVTHKTEMPGSSAHNHTVWLCAWPLTSLCVVHKPALGCNCSRLRVPELYSTPERRQALHLASDPAWILPEFSQGIVIMGIKTKLISSSLKHTGNRSKVDFCLGFSWISMLVNAYNCRPAYFFPCFRSTKHCQGSGSQAKNSDK